MFRQVRIPKNEINTNIEETLGKILLHSLPGKYEPFHHFLSQAHEEKVDCIICLISEIEIKKRSPYYYDSIVSKNLPFAFYKYPIDTLFIPTNRLVFAYLITVAVERLLRNKAVLIHCAEGIGRTGLCANCVLHKLGIEEKLADTLVKEAGSIPESSHQRDFVRQHAYNYISIRSKGDGI